MRIPWACPIFLACLLALAGVSTASAQSFQFSATPDIYTYGNPGTGGPANVTLNHRGRSGQRQCQLHVVGALW
jgi:hypothetical protein